MIKLIAKGFGKEEDLVLKHEIKLRAFMNCKMTLFCFQIMAMILEVTIFPEIAIFS